MSVLSVVHKAIGITMVITIVAHVSKLDHKNHTKGEITQYKPPASQYMGQASQGFQHHGGMGQGCMNHKGLNEMLMKHDA